MLKLQSIGQMDRKWGLLNRPFMAFGVWPIFALSQYFGEQSASAKLGC
jgi:hypothetical protein